MFPNQPQQQPTGGNMRFNRARDRKRGLLIGLLAMGIGVVLLFACVIFPLIQAENQDEHVTLYMKGAAVVPALIFVGAIYAGLGERKASELCGRSKTKSAVPWLLGIVVAAAGLALYYWLKGTLESQGYNFNRFH